MLSNATVLLLPLLASFGGAALALQEAGSESSQPVQVAATAPEFEELQDAFDDALLAALKRERPRAPDATEATGTTGDAGPSSSEVRARYVPRFKEGALRHAGTAPAVDYLNWLVSNGWRHDRVSGTSALEALVREHVADPRMARLAFSLALRTKRDGFPRRQALDAQDRFAENAATPELRAEVLFWRAYLVAGTESSAEERERALRDLASVVETGDAVMRTRAESLLFELQRLQVGMVAPDIEGEDLDGVAFRLSDYRGKVVLLDFWGDW